MIEVMLDCAKPDLLFQVQNIFSEELVNRIWVQTFKWGWSNTALGLLVFFFPHLFLGLAQIMKYSLSTFEWQGQFLMRVSQALESWWMLKFLFV